MAHAETGKFYIVINQSTYFLTRLASPLDTIYSKSRLVHILACPLSYLPTWIRDVDIRGHNVLTYLLTTVSFHLAPVEGVLRTV
jgi:hypothetical protein